MDPLWIALAFIFGFLVSEIGLPPLVGYLLAGFILNAIGAAPGELLSELANMGIMLLLFSIGLKLDLRSLIKPQVWAVATSHMVVSTILIGSLIFSGTAVGFYWFSELSLATSLILGLTLSFSSTVFAVKVLEEKGEMSSLYGKIAIGILVMQDIFAVAFLSIAEGMIPSIWALGLLLLIPLKVLIFKIISRAGHAELLVLLGLILAIGGAHVFTLVRIEADLGAFLMGILVAGHPKSAELSKSLLGFKDLFLVGFFLSIGLSGTPGWDNLIMALLLLLFIPIKAGLFFLLLNGFRLRSRTSLRSTLLLSNFSEFGLIVGSIGVANDWLTPDWLITIAISLSLTYVVSAPWNVRAHLIYSRFHVFLSRLESHVRLHEEDRISTGGADTLIVGMGRVGTGAYDTLQKEYGQHVIGVDFDGKVVKDHLKQGRNVVVGDLTDFDFCERVSGIRFMLLTLPNHSENLIAAKQMKSAGYAGRLAATTKFDDETNDLENAGVEAAFNIYSEAGAGFADHVGKRFGFDGR